MKGDDILGILLAAMLVSMILIFWVYMTAHYNGFKYGIESAEYYYEYTGEFPSEDWVHDNIRGDLDSIEAIEKTLYPYGRK